MPGPEKDRILVCLPFLTASVGGGAVVLLNLLEPLAKLGFDVQVVYFQERARELIPARFRSYGLIKRVGAAQYYLEYPKLIAALAGILRRERPSAIICNSYQPLWMCLAAKMISGSRAALIGGEQNNLTLTFRGAKWGRLRAFLIRHLDERADAIIVPAKGLRRHVVRDFGFPEAKVAVVPNPIALDRIAGLRQERVSHPWFERHDRPIVLNAGVLDEQKNQKLLLRAFAEIRATLPCRCVVLGDGPLRAELEAHARELGLSEDVAFLGFQDNPYKFMAKADAFVLSSNYEGFGLVLAEAMACECPVVSTDCDYGPAEVIQNSANGLLVPPGDPAALAQAVLRVLSDGALRQDLIENGRRRAQDFSQNVTAKRYADVIRAALRPNAK